MKIKILCTECDGSTRKGGTMQDYQCICDNGILEKEEKELTKNERSRRIV